MQAPSRLQQQPPAWLAGALLQAKQAEKQNSSPRHVSALLMPGAGPASRRQRAWTDRAVLLIGDCLLT